VARRLTIRKMLLLLLKAQRRKLLLPRRRAINKEQPTSIKKCMEIKIYPNQ
jgi:hypothetical protein